MDGNNVDLTIVMNLGTRAGGKIEITNMDVNIDLNDMEAELECLFPKYTAKKKYTSSHHFAF